MYASSPSATRETMSDLSLQGLRKIYGSTVAVENLDLDVQDGEMVAFLGPSGCGKTTTLRMVAGFVAPTAGTICVQGRDITNLPPNRRDMGMVFQSYALFPHMTVRANVAFGLKARRVPKAEIPRDIAAALQLVGLTGFEERYPRELSGGQQQRVALARVLALRPKLLLFDEPLSNLDAKLRVQMRHEIRRLQKEVGITALFVTHDQEEAMTIADRIVVMNAGRIEQAGTSVDIYDAPQTRFVADFIGTANLIPGRVSDNRFVSTRGLNVPLPAGLVPGGDGEIVLSIRPEKVDMLPAERANGLMATVERVTKLGSFIEYLVTLPSGDSLVVQKHNRVDNSQHAEGDQVGLVWRPEDARLLP
jgi:putative spermidine/putrescine transport system ATP-binding protein